MLNNLSWFFFAVLSAVFTGVTTVLEKKQTNVQHSLEFSSVHSIITVIMSIPLLLFLSPINLKTVALTFVASLFGTIAFWFWIKSLRRGDLSTVSPLINLNPAILAILAYFVLGESLSSPQLGGVMLIIIGSYILESRAHENMLDPFRKMLKSDYAHFVILSAILYAISSLFDKIILDQTTPITYLILVQIFISINFMFLISFRYKNGLKPVINAMKSWRSISLISLFTLLGRIAYMFAASLSFISLAVPVKRMSSLFTVIIGGTSFKEKNIDRKIIATIVMLIGIYLIIA
ncbi:MAG: EamA family transporter [Candidatus Aenigmatarchaeota archaeon]